MVDALADKLLPVGVDKNSVEYQQGVSKLLAASQLVGVLTAALTGGDASAAAAVTANATQYNNLDHPSAERLLKELQGCRATEGCSANTIREIVGRYEALSTQRSMAINACESRACVEGIQKSAVSLEAPVAKELMDFLRRNVSYDMAGLLTGNPGAVAVPSQGFDGWGALFTSDKQMAFAKNLKEGWLTPSEQAGVDQWVKETSWLDQQAGRQLSLMERAGLLTELKTTLSMEILGKSPVVAGVGGTKKPPTSSSTTGEKGPCCFAAGTMVSTPQGDRAIETLKVGDVVWSKPEKGGKPFAAAILATHQRSDQPIYRLKLKNVRDDGSAQGETLLVTPSHPFYVPAKRDFIPVSDLKRGDLLQSLADGETENTSSKVESLELYAPVGKTYNLTVDIGHTFYVGELKTWVHNTGPCDLPERGDVGGTKGGAASSGAENAALYPKLKDQLIQENLSNIAAQDSRLAAVVNGSGTKNPNFSIGQGTSSEANQLGKTWVGDGATKTSDGLGLISADGTRVYSAANTQRFIFCNDRRAGQF